MTDLNRAVFDQLYASQTNPEMVSKVITWIERLQAMETFRQSTHAFTDMENGYRILADASLPEGGAGRHNPEVTPHTLSIDLDALKKLPTDFNALEIVMTIAHEHLHHKLDKDVLKPYQKLWSAGERGTATPAQALDYMNAKLDDEMSGRYAEYRVAKEAHDLVKSSNPKLAREIERNLIGNDDLQQAIWKQENRQGHPMTEQEVLKDFRMVMLNLGDGYYLKQFSNQAADVAGNLDAAQLQKVLLHDAGQRSAPSVSQEPQAFAPALTRLAQRIEAQLDRFGQFDDIQGQDRANLVAGCVQGIVRRVSGSDSPDNFNIEHVIRNTNGDGNLACVGLKPGGYIFSFVEIDKATQQPAGQTMQQTHQLSQDLEQQHQLQKQQEQLARGPDGPTLTR